MSSAQVCLLQSPKPKAHPCLCWVCSTRAGGKANPQGSQRQDRSFSRTTYRPCGRDRGFRECAHCGLDKIFKNKDFKALWTFGWRRGSALFSCLCSGNGCSWMTTLSTDIFAWKHRYRPVAELLPTEKQNFCNRAAIPLLEQGFSLRDPQTCWAL